jgi:hypothetical protein
VRHHRGRMKQSGSGDVSLLRKAFPAENRPPLRWSEWDGGFFAALGAGGAGFDTRRVVAAAYILRSGEHGDALGLAGFAALGFVLKLFVVEKKLFPGGKDKVSAAIDAGQYLILKFH